jgi:hypothetical protein
MRCFTLFLMCDVIHTPDPCQITQVTIEGAIGLYAILRSRVSPGACSHNLVLVLNTVMLPLISKRVVPGTSALTFVPVHT